MKIKSDGGTENNVSEVKKSQNNDTGKGPKGPRWLLYVIFIIVISLLTFWITNRHDGTKTSEPKTTRTSSVKKTSSSKTSSSSSVSSSSSSAASSSSQESDMTSAIQQFFTAYQQYDTSKNDPKSRAQAMSQYATADAVADLIPAYVQNQTDQTSIQATYTLTSPIQITKSAGDSGTYIAVVSYKVVVDSNTNSLVDTYTVTTANNKITGVTQTASVSK